MDGQINKLCIDVQNMLNLDKVDSLVVSGNEKKQNAEVSTSHKL